MKNKNLNKLGMWIPGLTLLFLFLYPAETFSQENKDKSELKNTVWTMQSTSVSQELELKKKLHSKLTKSYLELRTGTSNQQKEKLKGLEGIAREEESDKIIAAELLSFNAKLANFLSPAQSERAGFILGSLNNRWDQYLGILIGYGMDDEAMNNAAGAVFEYIDEYLLERKKASDADSRFSGRTSTALKESLDLKISGILNEEQYADWTQSTERKKKTNQD